MGRAMKMIQLSVAAAVVVSGLCGGCSGAMQSTDDDPSFDPDSKADSASATPPVPFLDTTHPGANFKVGTFDARLVKASAALQPTIDDLDQNASYGCMWAEGARLAPADLAAVLADKTLIYQLAITLESNGHVREVDDTMSVDTVPRSKLYTGIYHLYSDGSTLEDWPADKRTTFKAALRTTVRSMLSTPTAKAWHFVWSPDYTDDSWFSADPTTGEVKLVTQGGDC
jgi:hypothetical protein